MGRVSMLAAALISGLAGPLAACVDWDQLGTAAPTGAVTPGILAAWNGWLVAVTDSTRLFEPSQPPVEHQALPPVSGLSASGGLLLGWSGSGVWGWRVGGSGLAEQAFHWDPLDEGTVESAAWHAGWLYVTARYWDDIPDPWDWGWTETWIIDLESPGGPTREHLDPAGHVTLAGDRLLAGGCLYSLADPGQPVLLDDIQVGTLGAAVSGDRVALVYDDGHRLLVGDLSLPPAVRWTSLELEWGGDWDVTNFFELAWVNDGLVVANLNRGFVALGRDETGAWSVCPAPDFPWMWGFETRARDVAVAGGRLWMAEEWGHVASLPLFAPTGHLRASSWGADLELSWDPGSGDLWTVHRSLSPAFPPGEVECLGTTKTPMFRDLRALERPAAFYRVTQGEPDPR